MQLLRPLLVTLLLLLLNSSAMAQHDEAKPTNWRCVIRVYELPNADVTKLGLNMMTTAKANNFEVSQAAIDDKTIDWLDSNANFITSSDTTWSIARNITSEWKIKNLKPESCRQTLTLGRMRPAARSFQIVLATSLEKTASKSEVDSNNYMFGLRLIEQKIALRVNFGHESSSLVVLKLSPASAEDETIEAAVTTASGNTLPFVPLGSPLGQQTK